MGGYHYNILSGTVFCPGQPVTAVSQLQLRQAETFHYKEATKLLKRKGFRYKDEATLMALVTAKLLLEQGPQLTPGEKARTGIIVCSNLGNIDTVVKNAQIIARHHADDASVMDLPNASPNTVSAAISIVNDLKGPNLMLCNGHGAGLDALQLAQDLMAADRADRMVILGVEVDNWAVQALFENHNGGRYHGSAAYLIEKKGMDRDQRACIASIERIGRSVKPVLPGEAAEYCGDASGATGIMQVLLAVESARDGVPRDLVHTDAHWRVSHA